MAVQKLIGRTIGTYTIEDLIGAGGMAHVYRAFDQNLQRPVAVKVLAQSTLEQPHFVQRFRHEALILARLRHPNIVQIYDFGEHDGMTYMVQELLPGPTLGQRLRTLSASGQRMGREELVGIIRQLASGLDAAHRAGVIHRDIKPSNAIWGPLGDLALTDFGIAKSTLGELDQTQTGIICGTPAYLSPEQAQGLPVGPSSDIYALGVVLYELLAGRPPFEGATPMGVVLKHIQSAPPPLSVTRPDLPPSVTAVVDCALAKEPEARFGSAGALASALEEAWEARFADAPTLAMDTHEHTTMLAPPIRIPQSVLLAEPAVPPVPPAATTALVASSRRYRAAWYAVPVVLVGLLLGGRGLADRLVVPPPQLTTMSVLAAPVERAHAQVSTGAPTAFAPPATAAPPRATPPAAPTIRPPARAASKPARSAPARPAQPVQVAQTAEPTRLAVEPPQDQPPQDQPAPPQDQLPQDQPAPLQDQPEPPQDHLPQAQPPQDQPVPPQDQPAQLAPEPRQDRARLPHAGSPDEPSDDKSGDKHGGKGKSK